MNATCAVGVAVQVADDHERDHVDRAHGHEQAQRVEDRGEHHREEEDVGQRAARSTVGRHCDRDQADVDHAPGEEERVAQRVAPHQPLRRAAS